MPLTVGTAGHIDHGKTALVEALTGKNTDRLPEEHERGISIDLGYAPLELPDGTSLSVVDVPGHERFVRTMVAGASGIDLFLLVIDAGEGARPQTHEHLAILRLLGIEHGVVAVTKADLVDEETLELARVEAEELVPGAPIVATSARTGAGLDELRGALAEAAARVRRHDAGGPARLHVDRAFTLRGIGTVATGTLWSGTIGEGDELRVEPRGRERPGAQCAGARSAGRARRGRAARRRLASRRRAAGAAARRRPGHARLVQAELPDRRDARAAGRDPGPRDAPSRHDGDHGPDRPRRRSLCPAAPLAAGHGRSGRPRRPPRGNDRCRRRRAGSRAAAARRPRAVRGPRARRDTRARARACRRRMALVAGMARRATRRARRRYRRRRSARPGCSGSRRGMVEGRRPPPRSRVARREALPARRRCRSWASARRLRRPLRRNSA